MTGTAAIVTAQRSAPAAPVLDDRILDAALGCIARVGLARTTLDAVARQAGCSRATVYRCFPGGKDVLVARAWDRELARFFDELTEAIDGAATLEDAVVTAVARACRCIADHDALQHLLAHEPAAILPLLAFDGLDPLLGWAADFAAPRLARFTDADTAGRLGEWVARLVVSYGFEPSPALDLADADEARRFVRTYVLPGVALMAAEAPPARSA